MAESEFSKTDKQNTHLLKHRGKASEKETPMSVQGKQLWLASGIFAVFAILTGCALEVVSRTVSRGYSDVILADQPLSYWRLNEKSGLVATDSGSLRYNLSYAATGVTYGQQGALSEASSSAVQLDGTTGRVYTATILSGLGFSAANQFSIELWIKTTQTASILLSNYVGFHFGYYLDIFASKPRLILGSAGVQLIFGFSSVVTDGSWHHLVFVHTASSRVLYVDGVLDATSYSSAASLTDSTLADFELGAGIAGGYGFFNGLMQDVALYGYPMTATQVQTHYQARTLR